MNARTSLTLEDLAANYFSYRSGTRLEAALRGPMAAFIAPEEAVVWPGRGDAGRY